MLYFETIDDILHMDETGWWSKEITPRGIKMLPTPSQGAGEIEYMGEPEYFIWTVADYEYHQDYYCNSAFSERYIEIGDNLGDGKQTIVHYETEDKPYPVEPGLNCFVNFTRWNLFSKAPSGFRLVFTSLLLREAFFAHYGITLPEDFWERAPQVLNPDVLYIPEISTALRQVGGKLNLAPAALAVYQKAKAMEVAALLVEYVYSRKAATVPMKSADMRQKIAAAQKMLDQNLQEPPVVTHLAELVGLNKNALQRGFRHFTGHSVGEYLRARRMEKALELLRGPDMPVAEIARRSGYQSPANFYNAFTKTFAMRPGDMRALLMESSRNVYEKPVGW